MKKAQYCILNKQYSKEEYEKLLTQIKKEMNDRPYIDRAGIVYRFGEFFPADLSYFAYNESGAQEFFPLSKEEIEAKGLRWQDNFQMTVGKETVQPEDIPDAIGDVPDTIVQETLRCIGCSRNYRLIPQELAFYRKFNIPAPRRCFYCRARARATLQNPYKLWYRNCMCAGGKSANKVYANTVKHFHGSDPCPNEFETSYAPDRPEIVYCEQCYQQEIA